MASAEKRIRKIVVLGGGSAGLLAAMGIAKHLPQIELVVIRSKKMGVLGVGEGTIPSVVQFLHRFLGLDLTEFNRAVRPSIKLGIKYFWGPRPFFHYTFSPQLSQDQADFPLAKGYFCEDNFEFADLNSALMHFDRVAVISPDGKPKFNQNFAYHLENEKLVSFFEKLTDELGVAKIDAVVQHVQCGAAGIESLQLDNGQIVSGDLFVDCSGFRRALIGQAIEEPYLEFSNALFCDRAVVGGWPRGDDDKYHPYTTAETMSAGWAWQIEHDELVNRGYVFCSGFLEDQQAVDEFRSKNPKAGSARVIRFQAGVHRRTWVNNVVAIGNAAGFVEPIEATAIGMICDSVARLVRGLAAADMRMLEIQRTIFNRIVLKNWEIIRDFLAIHYRFNHRIKSPFWTMCHNETELGAAQELVDYYREVGPDFSFLNVELKRDFFTAEGYLAMLVGQKLSFNRRVAIDKNLRGRWKMFKQDLTNAAVNGMAMREYLDALRRLPEERAGRSLAAADWVPADEPQAGELNWH